MKTDPSSGSPRSPLPLNVKPRRTKYRAAAVLGLAATLSGGVAHATDYTLVVDASNQVSGNPHFWSTCVGTGTASLTLRSDLQTHYQIANRELGMERVRGHGVLNDDMGIYKGDGSYDFSKFDKYLDAIAAAKMRPIMELSFMPTALASAGNSRNPPKDYAAYTNLIKAVVQHTVDKFGAEDVAKWYWEVWNEPNYSGFWTGTMDDYLKLYDAAVAGATAALPNIIIGGPATTQGSTSQMTQFINHVKSGNVHFNFVSSHAYAGGAAETAAANFAVDDNDGRVGVITTAGYSTDMIKSFNTEWNSSYSGQGGNMAGNCVSMDTHVNAPFIVKTVKLLTDKVVGDKPPLDIFSYWTISDVFDESSGPSGSYILSKTPDGTLPFGQVFGLMTFQGMRKAAYNGFKMLSYLGDKRLKATGGTGTANGVDALVTANSDGSEVQILVYNYHSTIATTGTDNVTVNVSNLPFAGKAGYVTRFAVDETHTNPYSVWAGQNKPSAPTEMQWEDMHKAQHLMPVEPVAPQTFDATYSATFAVPRQGASLIVLGLKRPLTGRNAKVEIEAEDFDGQSGITKEDSGDSTLGQSISAAASAFEYFEDVDYSDGGVDSVELRVKAAADTTIELHAETQTGTLLASCMVPASNAWATQTCKLAQAATGVGKLYVVFGGAAHLNSLKFTSAGDPMTGTGGAGGMGGTSAAGGAGGAVVGGMGEMGGLGGTGVAGSSAPNAGTVGVAGTGGGAGQSASNGGSVSAGGNGTGGGSGSSSSPGGRSSSSGGTSPSSGGTSGPASEPAKDESSSGCGCRVASDRSPMGALPLFGAMLGLFGLRRRRSSRSGRNAERQADFRGPLAGTFVRGGALLGASLGLVSLAAACSSTDKPGDGGSGTGSCANGVCSGQAGMSAAGSLGAGATGGTGGSAGSASQGTGGMAGVGAGGVSAAGGQSGTGGMSGSGAGTVGSAGNDAVGGSAGVAGMMGASGSAGEMSSGGIGGMAGGAGIAGAGGSVAPLTLPYLVTSGPSAYWKTDTALMEATNATADVTVNEGMPAQTWEGFGCAFNEMGWNYLSMLSDADRSKALNLLFAEDGINFAWGRIPMGATDYAMDRYTLDETAGDTALANFSIERDKQKLIPYVQAARAIKPDMHFWSSPWTPPTWLKDGPFNDDFAFDGGKAKTDDTTLKTLADYEVKFIQAYGELGLKIETVSPQNEPGYSGTYPTCGWDPQAYAKYVGKFLGPALTAANLEVKIMLGTFNGGTGDTDIVSTVMADATAKPYIKVLGYQWGMDPAGAKSYGVPIWQTEHKCGNYPWETYDMNKAPNDQAYAVESWGLIRDWIKKGVTAYSTWNLVLDTIGLGIDSMRVWPQNALLTVDTTSKQLGVTPTYYVFRHFSRFVVPGAKVVGTTGGDAVAFQNPDGSLVAVAFNSGAEKTEVIAIAGKKLQFTIPQNGWATVVAKP